MVANLIQTITDFFTSDKFQAVMTWIASVGLLIAPFLKPLFTNALAKWKAKYVAKSDDLVEALGLIGDLKKKLDEERAFTANLMNEFKTTVQSQAEAMNLAFSRSNLKEDIKERISKILQTPTQIPSREQNGQAEEVKIPTVTEVEANNTPPLQIQPRTEEQAKPVKKFVRG